MSKSLMSVGRSIGITLAMLMLGCGLSCALTACGKKASRLDNPGEGDDHFPLVYPDPATDPKPEPAK